MRVVALGSSLGGTFSRFHETLVQLRPTYTCAVVTDRECGLLQLAENRGLPHVLIDDGDNRSFSLRARTAIETFGGADVVFLFYSRLVTSEFFQRFLTLNLHPSLLPAFPGFHALRRSREAGVKVFGSTLHVVDAQPDGGPIVAQACAAMPENRDLAHLQACSFLQCLYLMFVALERVESGQLSLREGVLRMPSGHQPGNSTHNPCLQDPELLSRLAEVEAATLGDPSRP